MKNGLLLAAALPAVLLVAGCDTTGLSPREARSDYAEMVYSTYQRAPGEAAGNKPMTLPMRLAVVQIGETAPDQGLLAELSANHNLISQVTPLPMRVDADREQNFANSSGPYTQVRPMGRTATESSETLAARIDSVRALARDVGAEYVLLVGGNIDSLDSHTVFSALDLTVVGAVIVPSHELELDGKAAGAVLDVETGRVVLMANAEAKKSTLSPTMFVEQKQISSRMTLREQVLKELGKDVLTRLDAQHTGPMARQ